MPAKTSKLFRDISASTVQVIVSQLAGLAVFFLTSLYLPKDIYGELNWSVAVMTFATTIISLRLEQLLVRKAAAAEDSSVMMTLFFLHVLFSGFIFWIVLYVASLLLADFFAIHHLLLMMGVSQLLSFFSSPFRQVANGKEKFGWLAIMSSVGNIVRAAGLLILVLFAKLTTEWAVLIFIAGSVVELLFSYYLVTMQMEIKLTSKVRFADYARMIKESMPQIGTAIFMAGISRMDWILLGIFSTSALTAEYSFAYRVYELSPVPLLIIAPILLSRLSKFFSIHTESDLQKEEQRLKALMRIEMILATSVPLCINILWVPLLEPLTGGKYGTSNAWTFLVLSFCTPFQYATNMMWTVNFAQNRLRQILLVTTVSFFVILIGDLLVIPFFGTIGAALVYLGAMIIEYFNYRSRATIPALRRSWIPLLTSTFTAAMAGLASFYFFDDTIVRLSVATGLYLTGLVATRQLRPGDWSLIIQPAKPGKNQ